MIGDFLLMHLKITLFSLLGPLFAAQNCSDNGCASSSSCAVVVGDDDDDDWVVLLKVNHLLDDFFSLVFFFWAKICVFIFL